MTEVICENCGHSRSSHKDNWGGICVGCPCPGFESADAAESLPADPEQGVDEAEEDSFDDFMSSEQQDEWCRKVSGFDRAPEPVAPDKTCNCGCNRCATAGISWSAHCDMCAFYGSSSLPGWPNNVSTVAEPKPTPSTPLKSFLLPRFVAAMNDIGRYGYEKYAGQSFQARAQAGDTSRSMDRTQPEAIRDHAAAHFQMHIDGTLHDHFGTRKHQLAAVAFNAMMEYYFAGLDSEGMEQLKSQPDSSSISTEQRLISAIQWALGETDEFRHREHGEGAYWWRKELRARAFGNAAAKGQSNGR